MRKIKLTKGKFALVDNQDFNFINKFKWCTTQAGGKFYAVRTETSGGKAKTVYMHRFILNITDGKIKVDHKDGNGLNNQRNNLRLATTGQNTANSPSFKGSTSKYKGVSWDVFTNSWRACICKDGKKITIKHCKKEEDAALAYNKKAIELHGEFAFLNKIPESK